MEKPITGTRFDRQLSGNQRTKYLVENGLMTPEQAEKIVSFERSLDRAEEPWYYVRLGSSTSSVNVISMPFYLILDGCTALKDLGSSLLDALIPSRTSEEAMRRYYSDESIRIGPDD